jgi:hypothetical protein
MMQHDNEGGDRVENLYPFERMRPARHPLCFGLHKPGSWTAFSGAESTITE